MRMIRYVLTVCVVAAAFVMGNAAVSSAWAHCDGLDGPVVQAARRALDTGNANHVLIWVKQAAESEIKQAFQQALAVRKLGPAAQELADRHFFETVVRIHRQGEGAAFTGLKPAGRDLGPAVDDSSSRCVRNILWNDGGGSCAEHPRFVAQPKGRSVARDVPHDQSCGGVASSDGQDRR